MSRTPSATRSTGAHDTALAFGGDLAAMPMPDTMTTAAGPDTVARLRQLFSMLPDVADVADVARPRPGHPWAFIDHAAGVDVHAVLLAARRSTPRCPCRRRCSGQRWPRPAARGSADPRCPGRGRRRARCTRHDTPPRWIKACEAVAGEVVEQARVAVLRGTVDHDDARRSFNLGLALASVDERQWSTGLATFDEHAPERAIGRFVGASSAVRSHFTTVVPQQILRSRDFNPTATGGQVGLLQRRLNAKRGGMKVRELMTTFGDLITWALPCVLVSPDALARFLPAIPGLFDIVVFDEASQVRVVDAIGAMGRARSVVVVGDSMQMPPTSFAESSFTVDEPDAAGIGDAVEDEESILSECVQARVQRHRLTWHYRSRDESLIAFSNRHYHDGDLASFPAPPTAGTGVSLVRVDGHFHRSGRGALR